MLERVEILEVKTYLDAEKMEIREQLRGEDNILVRDLLIICNFLHQVPRLQYMCMHCHMVTRQSCGVLLTSLILNGN